MVDGDPSEFEGRVVAGKYRLQRRLGMGGFGSVFAAEHVVTRRRVALKLSNERVSYDPERILRFEREARATSAIRHPNLVEVFDAGRDADGSFYLVMELLEGEPLDEMLARNHRLPPERIAEVFDALLSGLAAVHQHGVVHRDLKPANVFLTGPRDNPVLKIVDFGLAKSLSDGVVTMTGVAMGTPAYMAPEQICDAKSATSVSDLWSVGVMLFECVAGRRPFEGAQHSLLHEITSERASPSIFEAQPDVPRSLGLLVDRLLSKEPAARPQSADAVRTALRQALDIEPWYPPTILVPPPEHDDVGDVAPALDEPVRSPLAPTLKAAPAAAAPAATPTKTVAVPGLVAGGPLRSPSPVAVGSGGDALVKPAEADPRGVTPPGEARTRKFVRERAIRRRLAVPSGLRRRLLLLFGGLAVVSITLGFFVVRAVLSHRQETQPAARTTPGIADASIDVRLAPAPPAPAPSTPPPPPRIDCLARSTTSFHFRSQPTAESVGQRLSAGVDMDVIAPTNTTRGTSPDPELRSRLYRVRIVGTGAVGFAFVPRWWFDPSCPPTMPRYGPSAPPRAEPEL